MGKPGGLNARKVAREVLLQDHEGQHATALRRADALALAHPRSALAHRLAGHLHLAAAIRARGDDAATASTQQDLADAHLCSARSALSAAKKLVPQCVDIATALGDALAESSLHRQAEAEYSRAIGISSPVDPARNNAAYGMHGGAETSTASDRVLQARASARRARDRLRNKPVAAEVERVLDVARREGAHAARPHAKRVAERFPGSARAQLLEAYVDLQFVRGLDAAADKRACLRRPLACIDRAAQSFPNSAVIAAFRAKLLFLLGEHDAAESECGRALDLEPQDPDQDCVPLGSISGVDHIARLVSLSRQFRELALKIIVLAEDYWNNSMTAESRSEFMSVTLDTLQEEYDKVDPPSSAAFTVSDAVSFLNEHRSWRFWVCPLCDDKASMKHTDTASLLDHLCSEHPKKVLPRLKSILDPETVLEGDGSFGGVTFCKDSKDQHDVMRFKPRNDIFKWMFGGPNRRIVAPRPFGEMREEKCRTGILLLKMIRKKLAALPADKSSTEYGMVVFEIQQEWLNFVERSVLDYRQVILTLARSFLWRELKKHMAEDPKVAAQRISAADIDAVFDNATEDHVTTSIDIEEQTKGKDDESADDQKAELHKVDSFQSSRSDQALDIHEDHQ